MKRKVIAGLLMLVMTMGMFAGCGKKSVDYRMGEETEADGMEEGCSRIAEYRDAENWTDEVSTVGMVGKDVSLDIDAKIVVPDVDCMRVVVAERERIDADTKEHFMKTFFENGEIYYDDIDHWTKGAVEKVIANLEEYLTEDIWDSEERQGMEENLAEYKEMLAAAPEEYVVAEEYDNCWQYIGCREDIFYNARFGTIDDWGYHSNIGLMNPEDDLPSSLVNKGYDKINYLGWEDINIEEDISNECKFTEEEARKIADTYKNRLGRAKQVCIEAKPMLWRGENYDDSGRMTEAELSYYGYTFMYGTGVDGVAFRDFPNYPCLATEWVAEPQPVDYFGSDELFIMVTDLGVREVNLREPVTVREVSDPVELLPLSTIQGILKAEVEEHGERYDFRATDGFNELELIYLPVKDESEEDVYSFVPVWSLNRSNGGNPVLVNAMDGSILYVLEIAMTNEEE